MIISIASKSTGSIGSVVALFDPAFVSTSEYNYISCEEYIAKPSRYGYNINLSADVFRCDDMAKLWDLTNINICKYVQTHEEPLLEPFSRANRGKKSPPNVYVATICPC